MLEHLEYLKFQTDRHFIAASLRGVGMDLRSGWTQSFHTKRYSRHNSRFNTAPQGQPARLWRVLPACGGVEEDRPWDEEWEDGEETGRVAPF